MTASATTSTHEIRDVSTGRVFLRTCAAEWSRLWSVKVTWLFLAAAAVIMIGIATAAGFSTAGDADSQGDAAWGIVPFLIMPAQFALLGLALMAVTADYATGGIVPTLQGTPRRGVLFEARALVAAGTATVSGVILAGAASAAGYAAGRSALTLPLDQGVDVLSTVAFVVGTGTLLAVGLGFLLRSTAGTLVTVFLLLLLLPGLLPQPGVAWLTDVADLLPGTGALFLLTGEPESRGLTESSSMVTMAVWAAAALALGWLRLSRDDANG